MAFVYHGTVSVYLIYSMYLLKALEESHDAK